MLLLIDIKQSVMKHLNLLCLATTAFLFLFPIVANAQTPTLLTLKASGVSSTETPEGSPNISVSATLNGTVNANGTNCTVSFEYGNTTSYGNTIAASPATVTASGDNAVNAAVTFNYTDTGPQERLIHYRVKVTNENGTYYGRDFVANPIFVMRNVTISAPCSDDPTMAYYDLTNNNGSTDLTISCRSGIDYSGSVIIGSGQSQQFYVGKGAICSFYYRNTITRQILTNDQFCSETAATWTKVFMTAVGTVGPGSQSQLFKLENFNAGAVTLQVVIGSETYTQEVPGKTVMYFAGDYAEATFTCDGIDFAVSSPTVYQYEGMSWLAVNAISSTLTSAGFELYNRDDASHTFILRNSGGTEYSYTLSPYEARNITLSNENWDVYTSVTDFTQIFAPPSSYPATFQTYGKPSLCYNGYLKVATAVPGTSLTPSVSSASIASSTSLTLNGTIANSAFVSADVDFHFIYGTDPANLNQSTTAQSGTVQGSSIKNVNATVVGLTPETLYYYKLVVNETTSASGKIFLSTAIPATNLKLHLRSDLEVTSASSSVSNWGDVSGWNNDASQGTSGNQPTITSSAMNGYPALTFNGSTSKLTLPTSASLGIQSNPYEMFIVAKSASSNLQFLIAGSAAGQFDYHLNGVGARFIPTGSIYLDKGVNGEFTNGNAHIFSARASASGGAVRVDGTDGGISGGYILSASPGNLFLGVRSDGTYYFNGDIAEVIIYNKVLTSQEREEVEGYLNTRYSVYNYTVTATPNSANLGTVTGGGAYLYKQTATLTATPKDNYRFLYWKENGNIVSTDAVYQFTVTRHRNLVAVLSINAIEAPELKTLTPTSAYLFHTQEIERNEPCYFNGYILPNGQSYTVYFEYGTDENFGYTTSPQTVGGTAQVNIYADVLNGFLAAHSDDIYNSTIHHRLVAVDASGNKFYGKDVPFSVNYFYNPVRVYIYADCNDHPTKSRFTMKDGLPKPIDIGYASLEINGTINLIPDADQYIIAYKYSVASFYYKSQLFKQVAANNLYCYEEEKPESSIFGYSMGTINNGTGSVYKIVNMNTINVQVTIMAGTSIAYVTIPATRAVEIVTTTNDIEVDYNENALFILSSLSLEYGKASLLRVLPVCSNETTASFEIENNDAVAHEFVLKNAGGTEYTYSLAANSYQAVSLPKENYDVYVDVAITANVDYPAVIGNHYKLYSVSPAYFNLSQNTAQMSMYGETKTVAISSNLSWEAISNQSWLTVDKTVGNGDYPLNITTQPNSGNTQRTATITITNSCTSQTITVTQMGEPGNTLNFDGTNDNVTTLDNDASITTAFTIESWVLWQPNMNTDIQFICGKGYEQMEIHTGSGANALRFIPTTGVYLDVPNILPTGIWTHIACTYDAAAATAKIYINGNETAYINNGAPIGVALQHSDTPFHLGCRGDGASYFLKGNLDEFRVWNRALSQSEIRQNMKTAVYVSEQIGLIDYYNFNTGVPDGDNNGQTTLTDLTGNYEGTLWNFGLTGSTSNWVESYAMVVPEATTATSITTAGFTANWTAPTVGIVNKYLLDVSTTNDFGSFVGSYHSFDCGTALSRTITDLTPNTQYYYRVRAEKTSVAEQGAYSNVVSARTTDFATSDNQFKTEDERIMVYPNPTAGKLYIDTNTLQKIKTIKLYNLQGQPVMCISNPSSPKLDISHFNTGMYLIEIVTESKISSDKIFKR